MRVLGEVVRLQAQAESLKVGDAGRRRYDPAPLQAVAALTLTEDGAEGWTAGGQPVPDVHHRRHPASKNRGGANGISICFLSHYRAMRNRFGDHLVDGIAAENILVDAVDGDLIVGLDDLSNGVIIEAADGQHIPLDDVVVAAPCVEFARYVLRLGEDVRPDRAVTEAVQFLHHGMRGFYATYRGPAARIELNAQVLIP